MRKDKRRVLTETKLEEVHRERGLVGDLGVCRGQDGLLVWGRKHVRRVVDGRRQIHFVVSTVPCASEADFASVGYV